MHPPPMKRSTFSSGCGVWARSWWLCATACTSKDSPTVSRSTRTLHHRQPSRLSQPTLPRLSPPTTHTTNRRRERRRRSLEISRTLYHRLSATAHLPQEVRTVWNCNLLIYNWTSISLSVSQVWSIELAKINISAYVADNYNRLYCMWRRRTRIEFNFKYVVLACGTRCRANRQ